MSNGDLRHLKKENFFGFFLLQLMVAVEICVSSGSFTCHAIKVDITKYVPDKISNGDYILLKEENFLGFFFFN